jgi:hypothetical protein
MGRLSDTAGAHTGSVYEFMAAREESQVARWARLDGSPFRYRRDRLARFRRGEPVEVEMALLPEWAPQKVLPPTGRVTIYPDDPASPAQSRR